MHADIIVFAVIAAFLVYRLYSVLGTRHGSERERPNPFADNGSLLDSSTRAPSATQPASPAAPVRVDQPLLGFEQLIDSKANQDGRIETGLAEIAMADAAFEVSSFMQGARAAFEYIVKAYARGDLAALKPLLSPKLYGDFEAGVKSREAMGYTSEVIIHRIKDARIVEAHLGGTMAYMTVDYDVEETTFTKDAEGKVVEGAPDRILNIQDVWTFSRDVRADDPNWVLIETKAADKPDTQG